jgi:cytochrome c-type biogenesis protein CcmH/NrfG
VIAREPHRLDARQNLVKALTQAGDSARAAAERQVVSRLTDLDQRLHDLGSRVQERPRDPAARLLLAEFYAEHGSAAQAEREFRRVLELAPGNARAAAGLRRLGLAP